MHVRAPETEPKPGLRRGLRGFGAALGFGGLLAVAVGAWPALRTRASGLDAPPAHECWIAVGLLVLGFAVGRSLRRSQLALLVAALGVAVGSVVIALGRGLGLANPGDLELALGLAATAGIALGATVPGCAGRGRWLLLLGTAVAAASVVALAPVTGEVVSDRLTDGALVLAPPLLMLVAARRGARSRAVSAWAALPAPAMALAAGAVALYFVPPPPLPDALGTGTGAVSRFTRLLQNGGAVAMHDRATQEMQLWYRGALVAAEGPDRPQSPFVATLLAAMLHPGDRVLVLGVGLGRLPDALRRAGIETCDVVDWRSRARPLYGRLGNVGPVADPRAPAHLPWTARARLRRGCRETLERLPDGARQAIVTGEALHAGVAWQCEIEAQRELRRVAGSGLIVQPFAMDRVQPAMLHDLLVAAAEVHAWNGVLAVGDCAVLLSCAAEPRWPEPASFDDWSTPARWQAHSAHIGEPADLQRTWLGTVRCEPVSLEPGQFEPDLVATPRRAGTPDRRATLRVLHADLVPAPALSPARSSLLLWWVDVRSRIRVAERVLRTAAANDGERVRAVTIPFLPIGSPSALLQGALALTDGDGLSFRSADAASLAAFAIDPTSHATRPPVLGELPAPTRSYGDLEDLARLPAAGRLVDLCSGDDAFAIALRVRFPSACAAALIAELGRGPLAPPRRQALRQLADPFVLEMAGRVLAERHATGELLGLWRGDLAMPAALVLLLGASEADRLALAAALAGRRDEMAVGALADLLVDRALDVRRAAAGSLRATAGDRIAYDPKWSRSKRFLAAEQVRTLHNRAP